MPTRALLALALLAPACLVSSPQTPDAAPVDETPPAAAATDTPTDDSATPEDTAPADELGALDPYLLDPDYHRGTDQGGPWGEGHAPYGTALGAFQGVTAYSNAVLGCTPQTSCLFSTGNGRGMTAHGYAYQCVEYVVRFFDEVHGYPGLNGNGNAADWWTDPATPAGQDLEAYGDGGSVPPQVGDAIVFHGSTYGHIAIVRAVEADAVHIIQQNLFHDTRDVDQALPLDRRDGRFRVDPPIRGMVTLGWLRPPGTSTPVDCVDHDGDGYGVGADCTGPQDCDDGDAGVHPGAYDAPDDGLDADCDGTDPSTPAPPEVCNGLDDDGDGLIDDDPSCFVTVYRFEDHATDARCWNDTPYPPALCAAYGYEREAFVLYATQVPGTHAVHQCSGLTDHILSRANDPDFPVLIRDGYDCSEILGYAHEPGTAPPGWQMPFARTCPVWRFAYDAVPGLGAHLFTVGADATSTMRCEGARFDAFTDHTCFYGVPHAATPCP